MADRTFYGGETLKGSDAVGGSRHLDVEGEPAPPWKCVACGVEQSGPIPQGCQACGAGKPGFKAETPQRLSPRQRVNPPLRIGEQPTEFEGWWSMVASELLDKTMKEIAGLAWAAARTAGPMQPPTSPPEAAEPTFSAAGLRPRTLAAALELFRDQVLRSAEDEIASGEWATVTQVELWIADYKAQGGF